MMDVNEIIQKVLEFLQQVATPAIASGFEIAVKRSLYIGIFSNIITVILLITLIGSLINLYKILKKYWNEPTIPKAREHLFWFCCILVMFCFVGILFNLQSNLRTFVPEWYAVQDIINLVK